MEIIVCVLLPFCCIFVQNFVDKGLLLVLYCTR